MTTLQTDPREWERRRDYAEVMYRRATGALPEMECSKAVASLLASELCPGDSVLDVGCGAGHYLRSLRQRVDTSFSYTGVDLTSLFIDAAHRAWPNSSEVTFRVGDIFNLAFADRQFDVVMCNNVLYNLPSIVKPLHELTRVARRVVLLRTLISDRSFRIQEVYSTPTHPFADVPVEREFSDDGQPVSFGYLNIYSRGYVADVVRRAAPTAAVEFIEDKFFDGDAINQSAASEGLSNPTRVVDGRQVFGNHIIYPWWFVVVRLAGASV